MPAAGGEARERASFSFLRNKKTLREDRLEEKENSVAETR